MFIKGSKVFNQPLDKRNLENVLDMGATFESEVVCSLNNREYYL